MATEIEKKYRITADERLRVYARLIEIQARGKGVNVFEENVIYDGPGLDPQVRVLRLRRRSDRASLTFKERFASKTSIKYQREEETTVSDADAVAAILEALGYRRALVYEKRRSTWLVGDAEVVVDELPFGTFVEIEGDECSIIEAETLLHLSDAEAEEASYPELTARLGKEESGVMEARFPDHSR